VSAVLNEQWRQRSPLEEDIRQFLAASVCWEREKERLLADLKRT
jgi:hypothetical protein